MTEEDLKEILPAHGDRIAVRGFAQRSFASGKQSLIERLKQKMNKVKNRNDRASCSSTLQQTRKVKNTRMIEIGWLCMSKTEKRYKQVRARNGGGTRRVTIDKNSKCSEVLDMAKELFFPNGKSVRGKITNFEIELVDYKSHIFDKDLTIQEMYELAALPTLRFYLATSNLADASDEDSNGETGHFSQRQGSRTSQSSQISFNELITSTEQEDNTQSSLLPSNLTDKSEEATSYLAFDDNFYLVRFYSIKKNVTFYWPVPISIIFR